MKKKIFLLTNDVETTSIVNHCLSDKTGKLVAEIAIPKTLELYAKYNIKTTFFITGYFAEKFPEAVLSIYNAGHEVGCHGYSHDHRFGFDVMSLEEQLQHLQKAKSILENIIDDEVISFRSPALRTNRHTPKALSQAGFKIDSSVASQRMDFIFSLGSKEKFSWLFSPRKPYFTTEDNLCKKGDGEIYEIPISAMLIPYIGTTMRIIPNIINKLKYFFSWEAKLKGNPINLLIHPIELIEEEKRANNIERRSANIINYLIKDKIRHKLKLRNLGESAEYLLKQHLDFFAKHDFEFITCKEYWRRNGKIKRDN